MRAKTGTGSNELVFEFAGGSNLDPAKDTHMHGFRVQIIDDNHIRSECELFAKGKLSQKHSLDLVRKK
jgi:hypothetical protein